LRHNWLPDGFLAVYVERYPSESYHTVLCLLMCVPNVDISVNFVFIVYFVVIVIIIITVISIEISPN